MTVLTDRFARAVDYARVAHAAQVRKGTTIPYITHLIGVAAIVIEFGGTEDQAIAGLLHDTIEDCGEAHEAMIRGQFGNAVADIVVACTDGTAEGKGSLSDDEAKRQDWYLRKHAYLKHLAKTQPSVLLVSASDKLHNARAIVQDLQDPKVGHKVFTRFKGGRDGTLGYYQSLVNVLAKRKSNVVPQLDAVVAQMHALAGVSARSALGTM